MNITLDYFLGQCKAAFRELHGLNDTTASRHIANDMDCRAATEYARRHRVCGLLAAAGDGRIRKLCRQAAYGQAHHSAKYTAEAERLFACLGASLKHIALIKGPALSRQAWPDTGLRAFDDLDLRCRREDHALLTSELMRAGYQPVVVNQRQRAHYWRFGWGNTFVHPEGYRVEANHRFFAPHYPWPACLRPDHPATYTGCRLDRAIVNAPTPEFHLLLACMHALWHGGERLGWIVDIAGLLVQHPRALGQAEAIAGKSRVLKKCLHTGCKIAGDIFGNDITPSGLTLAVQPAVNMFIEQLSSENTPGKYAARNLHSLLFDLPTRFYATLRRVSIPGDGDIRSLILPERLHALYWLYRPLRGFVKKLNF